MNHLFIGNNRLIKRIASHNYINDNEVKNKLSSDLFEFFNSAYQYSGGFKSFDDEVDLADNSSLWRITYDGEMNINDIDFDKIYSVIVFKQKYGLKLVAGGINRFKDHPNRAELKAKAKASLIEDNKWAMKHGWTEVSNGVETMYRQHISSSLIIDPNYLQDLNIFNDLQVLDKIHYQRTLSNGDEVIKVAYGQIAK